MNLIVRFRVIETGKIVEKRFDSYYLCRKFVLKLRHTKRCQILFAPNF